MLNKSGGISLALWNTQCYVGRGPDHKGEVVFFIKKKKKNHVTFKEVSEGSAVVLVIYLGSEHCLVFSVELLLTEPDPVPCLSKVILLNSFHVFFLTEYLIAFTP